MSVLVVGISHNTAPVALLERLAVDAEGLRKLITDVSTSEHVSEVTAIATCNRLEIYAEVERFHGSVEELSTHLVERAGGDPELFVPHLYVRYDDAAVSHLFQVAAGLDSMAVGEGQILGQTRSALRLGQELGTVGSTLNVLFQQALRVGKRARTETGVDTVAPSLVSAALDRVGCEDLTGRRVLVVGAGAMAGLATATVTRRGATDVVIANRTAERAERLAREYGGRPAPLADLATELAEADVVLACAGARGALITVAMAREALAGGREAVLVDLALPHDIEPEVREVPGATVVGLADLAAALQTSPAGREIEEVRRIITQEVAAFLAARRQANVTPTVVALRSMATSVVENEMERLANRLPDLDEAIRAEVLHTVRRVADKLLHEPTVRVKELANTGVVSYTEALAELFALDPGAVDAVTRPEGLQ
ncbi:glutamyl-tRNA reductase [Nocardioides sp. dk4132]|uniref:glutamyl-tRNA reductase n=1 Tax=unclassified Nocardioides TaxID=2615069 RepID=UPI001294D8BA|nr:MULTISPECIES: glutamyl-tRNA reductase [unclassified Nocardioides]MQW74467.1 glutamyl-tRNA reductase [Nocardioides sp. dk4132]QGA06400.1 glutamyl-tRNA reductase [Nocardioides sp. dk884]